MPILVVPDPTRLLPSGLVLVAMVIWPVPESLATAQPQRPPDPGLALTERLRTTILVV